VTRALVIVALACGIASADTSARAKADATAAYQEGQRRYLDEDYLGAAVQFEIAYSKDPDPAYLFNIAQAYRLAKQCARAAEFYRTFLEKAAQPPNADAVRGYITEMDACTQTKPSPPPTAPPPPVPPAPPAPRHAGPSPLWNRARIGLFVAGGLGLAIGGINTYYVQHAESLYENACKPPDCPMWTDTSSRAANAAQDRGRRDQQYMIAGYAVGAAALGGAIAMTILGRRHREAPVAIARSGFAGPRSTTKWCGVSIVPARSGAVVHVRF
jgi:tetratricopeptide (TPR) repeat protein